MIAALYVQKGGVYWDLEGVDPWDLERDARLYAGPHPVVAHPPCARWGRYWHGGPSAKVRRTKGDDGGCFAKALYAVQRHGGVLEHPEASAAWTAHQIARPPRAGGWVSAGLFHEGWTCCVEQGHYGHPARKATWLYVNGPKPAELRWGPATKGVRLDEGYHSARERAEAPKGPAIERLSKWQLAASPPAFRDLLLGIAGDSRIEGLTGPLCSDKLQWR